MDLQHEVEFWDLPGALFLREVVERGHPEAAEDEWEIDADSLSTPAGWEQLLRDSGEDWECSVGRHKGCVVYLRLSNGQIRVRVAGDRARVHRVFRTIRDLNPE